MSVLNLLIPENKSSIPESEAYFQSLFKVKNENNFTESVLRGIGDDCVVSNKLSADGSLQKVCMSRPGSFNWKTYGTIALAALAGGLIVYLVIKK